MSKYYHYHRKCQHILRFLYFILTINLISINYVISYAESNNYNKPIATDSRLKTFVYNPNEVFPVILHFGYQTAIELAIGESIQTYSLGNNYAWQFQTVGRTLFIKALEENISTNMIVITNLRRYYFELQSRSALYGDTEMAYAIRFFYPDDEEDAVKPDNVIIKPQKPTVPVVESYNFNYNISGDTTIAPTVVFDDGINTYFQYANGISTIPTVTVVGGSVPSDELTVRKAGNYIIVNQIGKHFKLSCDGLKATIKVY
jgi:type IV secretion system protein VirB9